MPYIIWVVVINCVKSFMYITIITMLGGNF